MNAINEHIAAMIENNHDKSDKKIEKQLHIMSVQITEILSKQSENIKNEVLAITSEHTSSEYNFEGEFKGNISPYNQSFEQPEEELIYFKG